jgi:Reverse transcriptase (RNA-dependent DNA polymerase)
VVKKVFPDKWREAIMIKDNPSNYRPIALTNVSCKVIEKMVKERFMWKLENDNILSENQNGFRKGRSTDNLPILKRTISGGFSKKKHTFFAFFDLKKAYDRVCRRIAINQVINWGIFGNILAFLVNFLQNRNFRVLNKGKVSNNYIQENGVPQGSVLSVTCFLIAINYIVKLFNIQFQSTKPKISSIV